MIYRRFRGRTTPGSPLRSCTGMLTPWYSTNMGRGFTVVLKRWSPTIWKARFERSWRSRKFQ